MHTCTHAHTHSMHTKKGVEVVASTEPRVQSSALHRLGIVPTLDYMRLSCLGVVIGRLC